MLKSSRLRSGLTSKRLGKRPDLVISVTAGEEGDAENNNQILTETGTFLITDKGEFLVYME